jgi:hypothetical protein
MVYAFHVTGSVGSDTGDLKLITHYKFQFKIRFILELASVFGTPRVDKKTEVGQWTN